MGSVNFISSIANSCKSAYNKMPPFVIKKDGLINKVEYIGRKITSPQQRVIMGATAVVMQPLIDWHNKNVDDDTRKISVLRTLAKILAGTATGFVIRYAFIKGIKAFSVPFKEAEKLAKSEFDKKRMTWLTPKALKEGDTDSLEHYRNAMGSMWALAAMIFTNFLIDAPLTKFLTNKFISIKEKHEKGVEK